MGILSHAAPDGQGGLFFADGVSNRIRHIRADGIIETVAGTGALGYTGDGGPATEATLNFPFDVALGPDGSMYVAELFNHVIRRIAPDGTITTYAGRLRNLGEGGPATAAILNDPNGVTLDRRGNLYVSESAGSRIRKIDAGGVITSYAGSGEHGQGGPGPGTSVALGSPGMLAADGAGNVYFIDSNVVWRETPEGTITSFAGMGLTQQGLHGDGGPATQATLGFPQGLAADAMGNVYIADSNNNVVRKVTPDGTIRTIGGNGKSGFGGDGGRATDAQLASPRGIALDQQGNLYFADYGNRRVRQIATDGTIRTVAGNGAISFLDNGWPDAQGDGGPAVLAQLFGPVSVAVDQVGDLFIGEHAFSYGPYWGNRIRRVTPDGIIDTIAGTGEYGYSGDGGLAREAQLHWVSQLAADASGKVYFADRLNYRVRVLTPLYGSLNPQITTSKK